MAVAEPVTNRHLVLLLGSVEEAEQKTFAAPLSPSGAVGRTGAIGGLRPQLRRRQHRRQRRMPRAWSALQAKLLRGPVEQCDEGSQVRPSVTCAARRTAARARGDGHRLAQFAPPDGVHP